MNESYVSRGGLKLSSVAPKLGLNFGGKVVLDVGSSTGGFSDYALQHGAKKVIAVDSGKNQMHPSLRVNDKIELHEKTDIRSLSSLSTPADIVVIDVSFISISEVLPAIAKLVSRDCDIVAMVKPQFEANASEKNHGVIKNDHVRRDILKNFESWATRKFVIIAKADSSLSGARGNVERFYLLRKT